MEWHSSKSAVSFGKSFCGCCLFGLLPRFLSGLLSFLDETQICLGFAGRRGWCPCLFLVYLIAYLIDFIGPCTNVFSITYAHVRTEPQSNIGQTRGNKNLKLFEKFENV